MNTRKERTAHGRRRLRGAIKVLLWAVLIPPLLFALVAVCIYLPPVQHFLRGKAVAFLEDKIGTPVQLEHLALRFPIGIGVKGLLLHQQNGDTLLYAGTLKVRASLTALLHQRIALNAIQLSDVRAVVEQGSDSVFNFDYIVAALQGDARPASTQADTSGGWAFTIGSVALNRIRLDLNLRPSHLQLALDLATLDVGFDEFNTTAMAFHVGEIAMAHTRADLRMASGTSTPDSYPHLQNPFAGLDFSLHKLSLEDIRFSMVDVVKGDSMWLNLPKAALVAEAVDLSQQRFALERVELVSPVFGLLAGGAAAPDTVRGNPPWLDQQDGFRYWLRDMRVRVGDLDVRNGTIGMHQQEIAPPRELFDAAHVVLAQADVRIQAMALGNDSMAAHIDRLAFTTGPGNLPFAFGSNLVATPTRVALSDGRLLFGGNELTFTALARPDGLSAAYLAPERVPFHFIAHSDVLPDQLRPLLHQLALERYLPPAFRERIKVGFALSGSMNQLDSAVVRLDGDQGSTLLVHAHGSNLREWPKSELVVDLDQFTLGEGTKQLLHLFAPPGTVLPERLAATAQVQLHAGAAQAHIAVTSDVGNVHGTVTASGLAAQIPDEIAADLHVDHLQMRRFAGDTTIGPVSLALKVEGHALNTTWRSGTLTLEPSELRYAGQDLSSLTVNGRLQGDSVFLAMGTDADALKLHLDARGKWMGNADAIALAFNLDLMHARLGQLGLLPYTLDATGRWNGQASFDAKGQGHVALNADGLRLSNAKRAFRFEHFALMAATGADSTAIALNSDAVTLHFTTNVPLDSIVPKTKEKLASYFKGDSTFLPTPGKYMDLAITLPKSDWLTGLVLPQLQALSLKSFHGHYKSDVDALTLAVDIPELMYDSIQVEQLAFAVNANGRHLDSRLSVLNVQRDSLGIAGLSLVSTSEIGALISTLTVQDGDLPPRYRLSVELKQQADESTLHIRPDGLVLDGKPWTADPANLLRLTGKGLIAQHVDLRSDAQRLQVVTAPTSTRIGLEHFQIGTLLNMITTGDSTAFASGNLNGQVDLPVNGASGFAADLLIKDLALLGNTLGDLSVTADEKARAVYEANVHLKSGVNALTARATANTNGPSAVVHGDAEVAFSDLGLFKPFAERFLYALSGGLNGKLHFNREHGNARLNGDLTFADARIGVKATHSLFQLQKERITFDNAGIHLSRFTMKDSLGNAFVLNGSIATDNLSNPALNLNLRTEAFQLVNSGKGANELFYGNVLAGLDLSITGTAALPMLKGEIHVLNGTDLSIVLPGSEVKLVSHEGIVVFTNGASAPGNTAAATDGMMLKDSLKAQLKGFELDLHLLVDDQARFNIVLDPTTGDAASFQGTGDLYFTYHANGDMNLRGPFTVAEGGYTLEFYGLVKKRFDLVKGSSVTWNGDPMNAQLNIKARYLAQAAAYGLVAGTEALSQEQQNRLQERLPFEVIIGVDGSMDRPDIQFGIDLERQIRNSYPQVSSRLDQLAQKSNVDERNRQVFGLLVTNAFIPSEAAGAAPSSNIVSSAARNSVNGILTDQLNSLTGKFIKGVDISLGVNTVGQAAGNSTYQRTSVDYKVSKRFFSDRLSFEVGGSVGVDQQEDHIGKVSNTRAAQYVVYYDLSKNGPFRLRGFYENAFDLYDGDITDSGIAIQYTKDFEENERARIAAREAERKRRADEAEKKRKEREARSSQPALGPSQEEE